MPKISKTSKMKINGEIVVRQIATNVKLMSESHIPINLGYIIKSNRINDFRKIIFEKIFQKTL